MVWYYVSEEKVRHLAEFLFNLLLVNFLSKITPRYLTFSTSFIIWLSTLIDSAADEVPKTMNSEFGFKTWYKNSQQEWKLISLNVACNQ